MIKKIPFLFLGVLLFSGCTSNTITRVENATYALTNQNPSYPSYLTFKDDGTFTLDFNICEGMHAGSGSYTIEGSSYFLDVEACTDCTPQEDLYTELPTVNIELEKISDTELKVQKQVLRTSKNGKKYGFCEISDAKNTFKLLESEEPSSDSN
jgi:hypothetical protein